MEHLSETPMWMVDANTFRIIVANAAAVRLFGYPEAELLTKTPMDIVVPASAERLREAFARRPFAGYGGEWTLLHPDGTPYRIEVRFHYIDDAGGRRQFTFADAIYGHPTLPDGKTKGVSRSANSQ
jgi:PAS domain S-box-containing protein